MRGIRSRATSPARTTATVTTSRSPRRRTSIRDSPYATPRAKSLERDVRTIPFLRFEDNESHGEGLFSFRFGDEAPGEVHGDREHPFIVRNLRAWESHYAIRPNVRCFLLEGLRVQNAAYGIYHPDYDRHVYRDVELHNVTAEPLNGGHDELSLPYGDFTYDRLTLIDCRLGRDPLIQLTGVGAEARASPDISAVSRSDNCASDVGSVDFGGGPRTNRVDNPVSYFFHGTPTPGTLTRVASVKIPAVAKDDGYRSIDGWTGPEARATTVKDIPFPELLAPVDDLPPATLITSIQSEGDKRLVRGVAHDNGEIEACPRQWSASQDHCSACWRCRLDHYARRSRRWPLFRPVQGSRWKCGAYAPRNPAAFRPLTDAAKAAGCIFPSSYDQIRGSAGSKFCTELAAHSQIFRNGRQLRIGLLWRLS